MDLLKYIGEFKMTITQFNNINEFNNSEHLTKMNLIEYFKKVHSVFYNDIDIDITFMDYFLEICQHDNKFAVHHNKLREYRVFLEDDKDRIRNCLNGWKLKAGIDYGTALNGYNLKPHAFKICLLSLTRCRTYAKYYLHLEKIFDYYNDYQKKYKTTSSSNFELKLDNLIKENKDQARQIESTINSRSLSFQRLKELLLILLIIILILK